MENLKKLLEQLKTETFTITKAKNGEKLQQTQSNNLKKRLLQAIAQDIVDNVSPFVYRTEKGIMLEIENQSIADGIENADGSGAITVLIDCVIKGLDCNAEIEGQCFAEKQAEKLAQQQAKAKAKAEKIARDKVARAKKKGESDE